jgi:hypothetical protein
VWYTVENRRVEMSGNGSGAYELKHRGKIHRASEFSELKKWVMESRVAAEDEFRVAGTEKWFPVLGEPEFAEFLSPDSRWIARMASGEYKAHSFEVIVEWARQGRITDDAVVEGPKTPPGGVKATALPAIAPFLRKQPAERRIRPVLRIDGQQFTAPDTRTIKQWITESRVPVDAEISLEGKDWEPVSNCGLFDLEDWPPAAHGRIEEEYLPEMPSSESVPADVAIPVAEESPEEEDATSVPEQTFREIREITEEADKQNQVPYTVISGNSETAVESIIQLKHLLKKKMIFSYDEIKHPSITEETISVGEFLEKQKSSGGSLVLKLFLGVLVAAAVAVALDYFVVDFIPWLP